MTCMLARKSDLEKKKLLVEPFLLCVRRQGFEPRLAGPEPAVLPLDDLRFA